MATYGDAASDRLARTSATFTSLPETALCVADTARSSLQGCDGAGLEVLEPNGEPTEVSTDARSRTLEHLQRQADDGPGIDTRRTGRASTFGLRTPDTTWQAFTAPAREQGLVSCRSLPLIVEDELVGVLSLYAWPSGDFVGWNDDQCTRFATRSSVLLINARAYARIQEAIDILNNEVAAIDDRVPLAHGVLMARHHEPLADAESRLASLAEARRSTLEETAQKVLDSTLA